MYLAESRPGQIYRIMPKPRHYKPEAYLTLHGVGILYKKTADISAGSRGEVFSGLSTFHMEWSGGHQRMDGEASCNTVFENSLAR
jgi:hypothetical protein